MAQIKRTVREFDLHEKTALLRCDFNVPLKPDGKIADDKRIIEALPTIKYLLANRAAIIICTHFGRPKSAFSTQYSTKILAERLSWMLQLTVKHATDVVGADAQEKAKALKPGEILMLENVRFHPEEEQNDPLFAKNLASLASLYINDAFGACHRSHASTEGVAHLLPSAIGLLIEKELAYLETALQENKRPFVLILGGAKVSDKLGIIDNLMDKVDYILTGGAMPFTFIKALGGKIGSSLCDDNSIDAVKHTVLNILSRNVELLLPSDVIAAASIDAKSSDLVVDSGNIPDGMIGMSIGPKTIKIYSNIIRNAATIIWNGPMGVFEIPCFAKSTTEIASAIAESNAVSIVGGGDSAAALKQLGMEKKVTHLSTGGGSMLEYLEGRELPGLACIPAI